MKSILEKVNENISGIGNWFLTEVVFSFESNIQPEKRMQE